MSVSSAAGIPGEKFRSSKVLSQDGALRCSQKYARTVSASISIPVFFVPLHELLDAVLEPVLLEKRFHLLGRRVALFSSFYPVEATIHEIIGMRTKPKQRAQNNYTTHDRSSPTSRAK